MRTYMQWNICSGTNIAARVLPHTHKHTHTQHVQILVALSRTERVHWFAYGVNEVRATEHVLCLERIHWNARSAHRIELFRFCIHVIRDSHQIAFMTEDSRNVRGT